MFEASVGATFAADHQLRYPDGTLEPLHRHEWRVRVTCRGPELDEMGVLVDFGPLRARLRAALAELTGRDLGRAAVLAGRPPSAENVARVLAEALAGPYGRGTVLHCVEVEEEPGCVARYFPPVM